MILHLSTLALAFSSSTQRVTRSLSRPLSRQSGPLSRQGMPHMLLPPEAVSELASTTEAVLSVPLVLLATGTANKGADVTVDLPGVFSIAGFTPPEAALLVFCFACS